MANKPTTRTMVVPGVLAALLLLGCASGSLGALVRAEHRTNSWGSAEYAHCQQPYNWTELIHGYKQAQVRFKSGGLGDLLEPGGHEVWVCLHDHYCAVHGDPWFCFVFHEGTQLFSPWGPNSQLQLIPASANPGQNEIERLWETWSQLKTLSETTQEQVRAVGTFLYHLKEEALEEKIKPSRRLSIFRGVEDSRAAPLFQSNRVLVVAPWNRDNEDDYPSYEDIVEYVNRTRLGATLLTEDEARANRQYLISEGEKWRPAWYGNPSAFYVAVQRPAVMNSCAGCGSSGGSTCTCDTSAENFYVVHICSWSHHSCTNVQPLNSVKTDVKHQSLALIAYWSTCSYNCLRF